MGKSQKPLCIVVDESLYQVNVEYWITLAAQGFDIIRDDKRAIVDLHLAPHAMRMTADMMATMPSAIKLAIAGSRALRYAPHGAGAVKGKPKVAKDKKPRKGAHSTITTTVVDGGTSGVITTHLTTTEQIERAGGTTSYTVSETTDNERVS